MRENIPANQIYVCGNTGIDALRWAAGLDVPFDDARLGELVESDARVVVVTAHRRENWGDGLYGIAEGIARLAGERPELRFVLPLHPNPRVRNDLAAHARAARQRAPHRAAPYAAMAKLLARCDLVITDSGGLQEEAPSLDKPVLVARDSTERSEGVETGALLIVGTDPDRIAGEAARLLDDPVAYAAMATRANPYGDGRAAERIVAQLDHMVTGANPPAAVRVRLLALGDPQGGRRRHLARAAARAGRRRALGGAPLGCARLVTAVVLPFEGLPTFWQVLFIAAFVVIVCDVGLDDAAVHPCRARADAPAAGARRRRRRLRMGLPRARAQRGADDPRQRRPPAGDPGAAAPHRGHRRRLRRRHGGRARRDRPARPPGAAARAARGEGGQGRRAELRLPAARRARWARRLATS